MSRYKTYSDTKPSAISWLDKIPAWWDENRLKYLFIQQSRPVRADDSIVTCFRDGQVTLRSNRRTEGFTNALKEHGYQGVRVGDLVIHSMDAFAGAIGVSDSDGKMSPVCTIALPAHSGTITRFYAYMLRAMAITGFIESLAKGIRERSTDFRWGEAREVTLPVPTDTEQSQIATFLDRETTRIDTLIEKKQRFIELLEEKRQAVITQAVTKGLDPNVPMRDSGVEWIGEVPAHWEVVKLRRLWRFISNGRVSTAEEETANSVAVSRIETISSGELNLSRTGWVKRETIRESDILRPGDILFSHINSLAVIGNCAEVPANVQIAHGINLLRIVPDSQTVPRFFLYLLRSRGIRSIISKTANPAINQASISVESLGEIQAVKLGFAEQSQITTFLDRETTRIDTLIQKTRESIELLKERRAALITAAVTGKIDVREEAT